MRYSTDETIALICGWKESESIIRVTFSDIALRGGFTVIIIEPEIPPVLTPPMVASVSMKLVLPNGIAGTSLVDLNLWGSEKIEFTDFTDESPFPADVMDRFKCCVLITYETGAFVTLCEAWPNPAHDSLRTSHGDLKQLASQQKG
jgi:hypothetical protein